mmetsp:Transcript_8101/g.7274  ORF Transcript_8101/g.7274 Transcript_8101/m.7274 type:complete len:384 (-) Transcript_8101:93-1244(-)
MITEFSETLSRLRMAIDGGFDETLLYGLFNCEFGAIQKSAFILLKHYYQNFPVKLHKEINEEKLEDRDFVNDLFQDKQFIPVDLIGLIKSSHIREEEYFRGEEENLEEESDFGEKYLLNSKTYSFLLNWIGLFIKLKYQLNNSSSDTENLYKRAFMTFFNENSGAYADLIEIVYTWLRSINLGLTEQKNIVSTKNNEVSNISPEWEDFSSIDTLFKLIVQLNYLFIGKFPKFFRKWYNDTSKLNRKEAEIIIRNFISNTMFNDEKQLIETKSGEWKSEEFNIYVTKSTRQIFASFMKDSSKLEIALTIPEDYPLSLIQIENQKGIKVSEARLKKCLLMMRTLLVNDNNTFLTALLIWKNNLEKEFEGVEECAICYYIVHSSTK